MEIFSENLKAARKRKNYTLDALANEYNRNFGGGLSKGTLSKYENGKQEPMIHVVVNLAKLLDVSVDFLVGSTSDECELIKKSIDLIKSITREIEVLNSLTNRYDLRAHFELINNYAGLLVGVIEVLILRSYGII